MSFQLSTNAEPEVIRPTSYFQPSIWGDQFTAYNPEDEKTRACKVEQVEELKEVVRMELVTILGNTLQQLKLIDAIQRLGVAYHFEEEIEEALQHVYHSYDDNVNEDLFSVALWFRLLRQQGYNVSPAIFNNFKNEQDKFRESLIDDVHGMLGLYEATHLRVHGEEVLDEALAFTTIHLQSFATAHPRDPLTPQVTHALEQPIHKGYPRLEARHYISAYQENKSHNKTLLKLAKLDFNLLQTLHRGELEEISRWWKELDIVTKLPFVRDRVVEACFWPLGVYFEPQYSLGRRILIKVICLITIMDDMYDAYATLEDLQLFTEAIERWDINNNDQLPDYMKLCYQTHLDFYLEVEEGIGKESGRTYRVIEAIKKQAQAYLVEAKWSNEKYIPTVEEYLDNGRLYSGYLLPIITIFFTMGKVATDKSFDWLLNDPKILRAASMFTRLMDDIASHKFEQEREHVASAVECYMKQHGVSEQHAYDEFQKRMTNAWKDINEECLRPTDIPMPLLTRILNFTRVSNVIYKGGDGYTHVGEVMKGRIAALLIDPVPI